MTKALFLLADGFEELEFVAPFDILKRGGLTVIVASISDKLQVTSVRNLVVTADTLLSHVSPDSMDILILPGGGPGTQNLRKSSAVLNILKQHAALQKSIAAICAAPLVLGDAGLLHGKKVTSFPSTQNELAKFGALVTQDRVVQDGLIFTSRGAGSAAEFGFALLAFFTSQNKADEVKTQMQFAL